MKKITLPAKSKIASFDIDAQNSFTPLCPDELPITDGDQIVDALNTQAQFASLRIGSKDAHHPQAIYIAKDQESAYQSLNHPQADYLWPHHAIVGSKGFELIKGLPAIIDYDYFIWKGVELDMHPYGACYHDLNETMSTGIIEFLKIHDISTVITGGLATDYCVCTTVLQLRRAGFDVVVHLAACRGVDTKTTEQAIDDMISANAYCIDDIINAQ